MVSVIPLTPACGAAGPLVQHHGPHDDAALHHLLVIRVQLEERETADDDPEDQRPDAGADDLPAPALQADAAGDGHGDGVKFVHHAHARLRRQVLGRQMMAARAASMPAMA